MRWVPPAIGLLGWFAWLAALGEAVHQASVPATMLAGLLDLLWIGVFTPFLVVWIGKLGLEKWCDPVTAGGIVFLIGVPLKAMCWVPFISRFPGYPSGG